MKRFALVATAALLLQAGGALAASVVPLPPAIASASTTSSAVDLAFNAFCGPGSAPSNACETAVAEFQLGKNTSFGNEIDARGADFGTGKTNLSPGFSSGVAERFEIFYDSSAQRLDVSILRDDTAVTDSFTIGPRFAATNGVFVRLRSGKGGSTTLSNLMVDGHALDDFEVGDENSDERSYLAIAGLDGTRDLKITGDLAFTFMPAGRGSDATFAAQLKFVDNLDTAPVPLPAGAVLLLTGLGALGVARRRGRVAV